MFLNRLSAVMLPTFLTVWAVSLPPVFGVVLLGDVDFDGDVDNADLAIIAGNDGQATTDGDVDGDFEVDSDDFALAASNFFPMGFGGVGGGITSDPDPAEVIYNAATGEVFLDQTKAPGGVISTFILTGSFAAPGTASFPFSGALFEDDPSVISQSDPASYAPTLGFSSNPHNLGAILPTGLDSLSISSFISGSAYVGLTGTGVREFDLVVIPEPTTSTLFLAALVLAVRMRGR